MIIFNITYIVEKDIQEEWLTWFEQYLIKKLMKKGGFKSARFSKVLSHPQPDATNYSIQFFSENKEDFHFFLKNEYSKFLADLNQKFQQKVIAFATEMEYLKDYYSNGN